MFFSVIRRLWTQVLIAFVEDYTIEGFKKTSKKFELPENLMHLEPQLKRKFTICNLFANQNLSIRDICVVLDATKHQVIEALIEQNLIVERRKRRKSSIPKQSALLITSEETKKESADSNLPAESNDLEEVDSHSESDSPEAPPLATAPPATTSKDDIEPSPIRRIA
ncbi:MAG: hypothetical protein U0V70_14325 [Terriglobia bacterium]